MAPPTQAASPATPPGGETLLQESGVEASVVEASIFGGREQTQESTPLLTWGELEEAALEAFADRHSGTPPASSRPNDRTVADIHAAGIQRSVTGVVPRMEFGSGLDPVLFERLFERHEREIIGSYADRDSFEVPERTD